MTQRAGTPRGTSTEWWLRRALVACLGVPALLFLCSAWFDRHQLLLHASREVERTADVVQEHALRVLDTHATLVNALDQRVEGLSWDEIRSSRDRLLVEMRHAIANRPQVSALSLTDGEGRQWASVTTNGAAQPPPGQSVAFREFWAAQRDSDQGIFVSRSYTGQNTGRPNFGISKRRTTADGSFDGTVHVAVTVSFFQDFWAVATRGTEAASVSMVRTDGEVLARYPVSRGVPPRLESPASELMNLLGAGQSAGTFRAVSPLDATDRFVAFRKIDGYPVAITSTVSAASILAHWHRHLAVLSAVCAATMSSLAFAVLAAIRQTRKLSVEQARRTAAERASFEGEKLRLVGQLAAGVAHDFRNILQSIAASASLVGRRTQEEETRRLVERIDKAVAQGSLLTRRMLSVAQGGDREEAWEDAIQAVRTACELLEGTVGATHRLVAEVGAGDAPLYVHGRRSDLEAAVMNLVVNARDASPPGSTITVRVTGEHGTEWRLGMGEPSLLTMLGEPRLSAKIAVIDHGAGMPPDVLARATEAFFTTKPAGQGTGLGLAGVKSFVERAGGRVAVESAAGLGTTVTLWLPASAARPVAVSSTAAGETASDAPLNGAAETRGASPA